MTTLKWISNAPASVLYAAGAVAQNLPATDPSIDALLIGPVSDINSQLGMADLDLGIFWQALVASGFTAVGDDASRCEAALTAAECSPLSADTLARTIAGKLTDIRLAFHERFPKLAEQIPLRGRPLQSMWQERGRGLLLQIAQQTHAGLLPKRATIHLVQPICGGGGQLDSARQNIWVEAMLTNTDQAVPEILRVAWLVSRLGMGQGQINQMVDQRHLPPIAALALVPIVLSAGQALELVAPGPLPIQRALELWQQSATPQTSELLIAWWQQWTAGHTPFPVAIKALGRMLFVERTDPLK